VTIFIDSGGWRSVLIESDQYHEIGTDYFRALMAVGAQALTTDYVLDEVITRLRYDVGHAKAAEFLGLIHDATDSGALAIHRIDKHLWVQAEAIFLRYGDACLSFTDCTSFALLNEQVVDEIFGYDVAVHESRVTGVQRGSSREVAS
jgi:predicted nucleic acid-binding protein